MKKSNIGFSIALDKDNIPERIEWEASDKASEGLENTKAISLSIWDHMQKNTLRIDLWTKEMPVDEMKRFYVDIIGGLSQSLLSATGDEKMSAEMNALCDRLVKHIESQR